MSNRKKGFSLVEIMLVVAGVAGLALVVMQLSKNSAKTQTDSLNFADYIALKSEVDNFFNNDYDCTVTLKDLTFRGSTIKDTPVIVELWHGDQDLNKSRKFLSATDLVFKKYGKLGINSIEFNMPDYTAAADFPEGTDIAFKAQIVIEGDKTSFGKTSTLRPIKKSFSVIFDTAAGGVSTIKSCKLNSGGSSADLSIPPDMGGAKYCILASTCPTGWIDNGRAGIIANYGDGAHTKCGSLFNSGLDYNGVWGWCHPKLCCNN
jgi:type II secretory pathway pseudopilin PulG